MSAEQQPLFVELEDVDSSITSVLHWIIRSYDSTLYWKDQARALFFTTNGQSDVARNRLASILRRHFQDNKLETENVHRWKANSSEMEMIAVEPPKLSDSTLAYLDWQFLADYLLLTCAALTDELLRENQERTAEYRQLLDSYNIQIMIHHARTFIQDNRGHTDDDCKRELAPRFPDIKIAHIKEARRRERKGGTNHLPLIPLQPAPLPRYQSIYFPDVNSP
ncbi:MAG: hypothetical protein ACKPEY_06525 [Planctomycetota bacterium]